MKRELLFVAACWSNSPEGLTGLASLHTRVDGWVGCCHVGNEDITSNRRVCSCHWLAWRRKPLTLPPRAAILIDSSTAKLGGTGGVSKLCPIFVAVTFRIPRAADQNSNKKCKWDKGSVGEGSGWLPERLCLHTQGCLWFISRWQHLCTE